MQADIDQEEHIHDDVGDVKGLISKLFDQESRDEHDEGCSSCYHSVNLRKLGQKCPGSSIRDLGEVVAHDRQM